MTKHRYVVSFVTKGGLAVTVTGFLLRDTSHKGSLIEVAIEAALVFLGNSEANGAMLEIKDVIKVELYNDSH